MATYIWVSIGSGNGLVSDGTYPLPVPEPMLTYHQRCSFCGIYSRAIPEVLMNMFSGLHLKTYCPGANGFQWLMWCGCLLILIKFSVALPGVFVIAGPPSGYAHKYPIRCIFSIRHIGVVVGRWTDVTVCIYVDRLIWLCSLCKSCWNHGLVEACKMFDIGACRERCQ